MARKKREEAAPSRIEHGVGALDAIVDTMLASAGESQFKAGRPLTSLECLARLVCIPLPGLAARFLFGLEGYPLHRFAMLSGKEESCKSSFSCEIGRWHRAIGGLSHFIDVEVRDQASLRDSIFGYDPKAWKRQEATTLQEWNIAFSEQSQFYKRAMDGFSEKNESGKSVKRAGIGRVAPVCLVVDSMCAAVPEAQFNQIEKDGHAELTHPVGAKLLADFLRKVPKDLQNHPLSFVAINHVSYNADPRMPHIQIRTTKGGSQPRYQMTFEIDFRRIGKHSKNRFSPSFGDLHYVELELSVMKNSLADHTDIKLDMCWYFDEDNRDPITGEPRQFTFFDWPSASIDLLIRCGRPGDDGAGFSSVRARQIRDLMALQKDDDRKQIYSPTLGIPADSPVSYYEAGLLLEQKIQTDTDFARTLYGLLGIRRSFLFRRGVDLRQQIDDNLAALSSAALPQLQGATSQEVVGDVRST